MGRVSKNYCDRCGKEIKYIGWTGWFKPPRTLLYFIIHNGNHSGYEYHEGAKELCADCVKSYKEWMKAGEHNER